MLTVALLLLSNIHDLCLYGHLKYTDVSLWKVIGVSWGIAFFEYCLMVPANRLEYGKFSAVQLKTIQEIITLTVFAFFSVYYLKEEFRWNYLVGFVLIVAAAYFVFKKW